MPAFVIVLQGLPVAVLTLDRYQSCFKTCESPQPSHISSTRFSTIERYSTGMFMGRGQWAVMGEESTQRDLIPVQRTGKEREDEEIHADNAFMLGRYYMYSSPPGARPGYTCLPGRRGYTPAGPHPLMDGRRL